MTLEDISHVANFVGVVLVIASLMYVARQLRLNTEAMRAESRSAIQHGHQQEILVPIQYPEIWRRFSGEQLDDDAIRMNQFLTASLRAREYEWFQFKQGALDNKAWAAFSKAIPVVLASPAARGWWQSTKDIYDQEFTDLVDDLLSKMDFSAVHQNQATSATANAAHTSKD